MNKNLIDKGTISFQVFQRVDEKDSFMFQPKLSEKFIRNTDEEKGQFLYTASQWCENNSEEFKKKNFGRVDGDMFEYRKRKRKENEYNKSLKEEKGGKIIIEIYDDFLGNRYIKPEQDENFIKSYSIEERNDIINAVGTLLIAFLRASEEGSED